MDRATELQLIHEGIMKSATEWAEGMGDYWKGKAAGLTYAYLIITDDHDGYNEYYAMIGT